MKRDRFKRAFARIEERDQDTNERCSHFETSN